MEQLKFKNHAREGQLVTAIIEKVPVFLIAPYRANALNLVHKAFAEACEISGRLSAEERAEVETVYERTGGLKAPADRPYRAPHHTASLEAILGGGQRKQPCEWELATHGVLILDEVGEFRLTAIESIAKRIQRLEPAPVVIALHTECPCGRVVEQCRCPEEWTKTWHRRVAPLRNVSLTIRLERS